MHINCVYNIILNIRTLFDLNEFDSRAHFLTIIIAFPWSSGLWGVKFRVWISAVPVATSSRAEHHVTSRNRTLVHFLQILIESCQNMFLDPTATLGHLIYTA